MELTASYSSSLNTEKLDTETKQNKKNQTYVSFFFFKHPTESLQSP